jgi:AbrB family looped-hinge helix DNA binding protein
MGTTSKESTKMKVFPKGQVVIPISLRKKYHIEIGDKIDIIPTSEGILLKSVPSDGQNQSLTERLFGIFASFGPPKHKPTKDDIATATEEGFSEDWAE